MIDSVWFWVVSIALTAVGVVFTILRWWQGNRAERIAERAKREAQHAKHEADQARRDAGRQ